MNLRILALLTDRTTPPHNGARVRNHYLWPALRELGVEVKILAHSRERFSEPGIDFFEFDRYPLTTRAYCALTRSHYEWPLSTALERRMIELVRDWKPHIVHAEELKMANYLLQLKALGLDTALKKTLTVHNVESELAKQTGTSSVTFATALTSPIINFLHMEHLLEYEEKATTCADQVFTYSELDKKKYELLYPNANFKATRNGTPISSIQPTPQSKNKNILIVGSLNYFPNIQGIEWFLKHVSPLLEAENKITVAGSNASLPFCEMLKKYSNVHLVESPESLAPLYEAHALSIVPLLSGGGTRTKILESLAYERCVVSTTIGAEGLDLSSDEGVFIANDPRVFADEIKRLIASPELRTVACKKGREKVKARYDWRVVAQEFKDDLLQIISRT